jgi:elongation factor Ts
MPDFTAKDVQALREMTGVGMMDCKKALQASDGDKDKAVEFLREKGLAAAAKKASRIASDGMVFAEVYPNGVAVVVEVNSETDFVAQNADFQKFTKDVASVIAEKNPADVDALMELPYPGSELTVADMQRDRVLVIGENIRIRRFVRYDTGYSVSYIHMGGKIGVLVNLQTESIANEAVYQLGRDLAMQVAAMSPKYLNPEDVDAETLETEKRILKAQVIEEGRPENMADRIVAGRIGKFFEEFCLMKQAYVKENKITVEQHVAQVAKELGGKIQVMNFVRFEKGEGLEKRSDNLADEVAKMVGQ